MNDFFSPRRFALLFRKTLLERPVQMFGLTVLTLVGAFILYAVIKSVSGFEEAQNAAFIIGLTGGGSFLAASVFGYFSSLASGSSFLTLPASHFEKWLCAVLIAGVVFPAIFLAFFHLADIAFVQIYHSGLHIKSANYHEQYEAVQTFALNGFVAIKAYILFANFTGAMLIGSLYFNKVSFIKVALIICGLFIAAHLLDQVMARMVFDHVDKAIAYYCVFISVGNSNGKVELPANGAKAVDITMQFILPAILFLVAYIRLREKEF